MESPTYEEQFKILLKSITAPKLLTSLQYDTFTIVYNDEEIEIDNIYKISTVSDLKYAIYEKFNLEGFAAPNNQLLFYKTKTYINVLDYSWGKALLPNPEFLISEKEPVLSDFVSSDGTKKIVDLQIYDNSLITTRVQNLTLHLYFYKDLIRLYKGVQPISEKQYYGRIYPYFPYLKMGRTYPNDEDIRNLETRYSLFKKKTEYLHKIERLLKEDNPLITFSFIGIRYLQLSFLNNDIEDGIESLFYDMVANEDRPYIRLIPVGSTPISKVHLKDESLNIPSVYNPNLIKQWSDEKSPTPERDFILAKVALKTTLMNLPYIYSTVRICDDGSFDLTIEPPKDVRKVDPYIDFENFMPQLLSGIDIVNKDKIIPKISSSNLIFGFKLPTEITLTKKQFERRLQLFKPFFQEISPLPNEHPFIMLRYKLVNNYVTEDNISMYLTLLSNKKILKGEATVPEMIKLVSDEFQLDMDTARQKVENWWKNKHETQPNESSESREHLPYNNSGIDIAIHQKKSIYTLHFTNIDSVVSLQRILTAFGLIFSLDDELLSVTQKEVKALAIAEQEVSQLNSDTESVSEEDADIELDELMFLGQEEEVTHEDVSKIKEEIAKDTIPVEQEVQGVRFPVEEKKPVYEEAEEEEKDKGLAKFFINKLKEADKPLFEYNVSHPSDKAYVQMCAANDMRQPAVLNQDQYAAMREEYAEDEDIIFQVYPLPEGEEEVVNTRSDPDNIITVLRYGGSNPRRENYYVCSEFFCTRDEIVVLKRDFRGTTLRRAIKQSDGSLRTSKPPNTCPFCMGVLVKSRKDPGRGETVLQRTPKPKSDKRHVWINFLKKTSHPNGLKLPCCFVRPSTITFKDTESGFLKKKKLKKVEEDDEEDEAEAIETLESGAPIIDYSTTLYRIDKKYIIGLTDKYLPLEIGDRDGPQIGVLPKELNTLFEQDPANIITRIGNPQKVLPNAKGFLRIAVENRNRYKYDSFLAAIAPYYLKNSAYQMKKRILEVLTPSLFINLNYGNSVLEFYDPQYTVKEITSSSVWADKNLNIDYNDNNAEEIDRIIKSFYKFKGFLLSDSTTKEYRQFASLLAQPRLLQDGRPGINFIIIDMKENGNVNIRCPPFGFNNEYMGNNDVAFILHHYSGSWEPIVYVDNLITGLESRQPYSLVFQYANYASWPSVAKKIYGQYQKACSGQAKTIYTSHSYIKSSAMISLSSAERSIYKIKKQAQQADKQFSFHGILRDAYNHISGIVCSENRSGKRLNIVVPVIDDGIIENSINKQVYLNWDDIEYESAEDTVRIYRQYILPAFPRYQGYTPAHLVVNSDKIIVAIQLKNLLYIPVAKAKTSQLDLSVRDLSGGHEFEWEINREIIFGTDEEHKEVERKIMNEKETEEIYQHLRITFSNWLETKGSAIKKKLEDDIIFNSSISLNDKRKRLIVLFGSLIQSWFSTETNESTHKTLLRKDCELQTKSTCNDRCVFTTQGKCKLHVSKTFKDINLANYLMLKLFDELLRYAEKRREIFHNEISKLVFLDKPIRIGDQYILPENTVEWSDFLRFSWAEDVSETPHFYEEFSAEPEFIEGPEEDSEVVDLPKDIYQVLNPNDPKTSLLKYYEITDEKNLTDILDELNINSDYIGYTPGIVVFNRDMLTKMYRIKKAAFIQINLLTKDFILGQNITSVGLRNAEIKKIYVIVISHRSSGFIVKNSKDIVLRIEDLPEILKPVTPPQ
jgi:hypothetical protein